MSSIINGSGTFNPINTVQVVAAAPVASLVAGPHVVGENGSPLARAPEVQAAEIYQNALEKFDELEKLVPKNYAGTTPSLLTKEILRDIIEIAARSIGKDVTHEVNNTRFVAKIESSGQLFLTQLGEQLGQGGFGTTFATLDLLTGTEEVLKLARTDLGAEYSAAAADVQNEADLLHTIHKNGSVYGIQEKPNRIVYVQIGGQLVVGFLGKKYDGDFNNKRFKDMPTTYSALHQLLSGLNYLSTHGYAHGGLKPENILIQEDTGKAHIADMSRVRELGQPGVNPQGVDLFETEKYTHLYTAEDDMQALCRLAETPRKRISICDAKMLRKSMDVFAMGLILYESLAKMIGSASTSPCPYYPELNTVLAQTYKSLPSSDATIIALDRLIQQMLNSIYTYRLPIGEAQKQYEAIMASHQPEVWNLIQENMRTHSVVAQA